MRDFSSDIFAALTHPLCVKQLHFSCWQFWLKSTREYTRTRMHMHTHTHTEWEQKVDSTAEIFPSHAQADALRDRMKSCTPRAGAAGLTQVPGCRQLHDCGFQNFTALSKKIVQLKVKNKRSPSSACSRRQSLSFSSVHSIHAFINREVIFGLSSLTPSCWWSCKHSTPLSFRACYQLFFSV